MFAGGPGGGLGVFAGGPGGGLGVFDGGPGGGLGVFEGGPGGGLGVFEGGPEFLSQTLWFGLKTPPLSQTPGIACPRLHHRNPFLLFGSGRKVCIYERNDL